MASKLSSFSFFSLFLFLSFSSSHGNLSTSTIFNTPDTVCNLTSYPAFCISSLRPYNKSGTILGYGRFSLQMSLSNAKDLLSRIEHYLSLPTTTNPSVIFALEDCKLLAELIIEYFSDTIEAVKSKNILQRLQADDFHTLLSAALTNQNTCLESLDSIPAASSIKNELLETISNHTKLYSISLALYKHGWVQENSKKGRLLLTERKHIFSKIGASKRLPLRMSRNNRRTYESISGRKLLQTYNGVNVSQMVVVNPDGTGNFTNISDAVNAAPNKTASSSNGYFLIYVVAGVYNEYVSIPSNKKYLMMIGDGINRTIITGNRSAGGNWTTFNSATFAVVGQGFVAVNITFQNTAGAINYQAVAVRNGADLSTFYLCSFEGYQDTLYAHSLRQFYSKCDIYGTIDYIFGNAAVVFQECNIYSRLPLPGQYNTVTAQGRTDINQNTGTSIQNCDILADETLLTSNQTVKTYLGRPWKVYSRTVVMQSFLDSLIDPAGWAPWSGNFALDTLYYAEFNNSGPGSNTSNRVQWVGYHVINETDAVNFTVSSFIAGDYWLPPTTVPYVGGLY